MPERHNIVVLGASYAGLGAAHYILKHVVPKLPKDASTTYKVVLVNPSSKFFQRHASPRAAVSEQLIGYDRLFLDIEPGFEQYGSTFQFVEGKAVSWDTESRSVMIERTGPAQGEDMIEYHALVLATGSRNDSPLFSAQGTDHTATRDALDAFHAQIANAKNIVITGGGSTAVETAGEIGEYLNGAAGCFSSRPAHPKAKISIITNSTKLLPQLRQAIADQAEVYLRRVGVKVRYQTKVISSHALPSGKTAVVLHDGEELETDIYIPAIGVTPMSKYVPQPLRDPKGYVKQNLETLRVDAAGPRVYAVGDVGSASRNDIPDIFDQIPVLATNVRRDLMAAHSGLDARAEGKDRVFEPMRKEMQFVTVGRSKGVGALFGYRMPSLLVWLIKGRDYMLWSGEQAVSGSRYLKGVT